MPSKAKPKKKKKAVTTAKYLAEFKYESEDGSVEEIIAEFPITVPKTFEQLEVEEAKQILLRVLAAQKGKITHIFLWTPERRLVMSSAIAQYSEFGKEAEAYVSPEDEDILKIIIAFFLRAVTSPYPPFIAESKPIQIQEKIETPMTKKEQQNIAKSMVKSIRLMRISREDKFTVYYAFVSGLALSDGFNEDYLFDIDVLLNEALRDHKKRNKDRMLTPCR